MNTELRVSLWELASALGDAVDLVSPAVAHHHSQVARIARELGAKVGFNQDRVCQLAVAGFIHDIGALYLRERLDLMHFELAGPHQHAQRGYELLRLFEPLKHVAAWVRFHHVP